MTETSCHLSYLGIGCMCKTIYILCFPGNEWPREVGALDTIWSATTLIDSFSQFLTLQSEFDQTLTDLFFTSDFKASSIPGVMAYNNLSCMRVQVNAGVAWLTLHYPPINLFDGAMAQELDDVTKALEYDTSVRVVVMQSAVPQFFVAHSGLARVGAGPKLVSNTPNFRSSQIIAERLRNMSKVTIAKVEGIARGGGNELVLGADMCFAALETAVFGQPEVGVGLVPGGGSTQRLPSLVGRSRALEILLGGDDFSAADADRFGWINRAMSAAELGPFVEKLAMRIASFPPHTIAHIKAAVNQGVLAWIPGGLLAEAHQADLCIANDISRERVKQGLHLGMETLDGELNLWGLMAKLKPANPK